MGTDESGEALIIRTYLDETGIHDGAPVTAVAAYFAKAQQWKMFTRRWLAVLRDFGLTQFHMNDYAQRHRAFEDWSTDRQRELAERLFPLIPAHTEFGVSVAYIKSDMEEIYRDYPNIRQGLGRPYTCCFQWLISLVVSNVSLPYPGWRLGCIHEDNDFKREAIEAWDWVRAEKDVAKRLGTLAFTPKVDCVPLQAADVLAWESQKRLAEPLRPERKSLTVLKENITLQVMSREWLKQNAPRLDAMAAEHLHETKGGQ